MSARVTVSAAPALCAFLALAAATGAEAQPATLLSFDSQPGDWVGGGQKLTLTPADGTFSLSRTFDLGVSVSFDGGGGLFWHLYFAAPGPSPLVPGMYEAATRWPFQSPTEPGLAVSGEGRGCNRLTGRFVVLEAVYDGSGNVQRFAADYEQHCEGAAPALFGSVRYESAVAVGPRLSASGSLAYEGDVGTAPLSVVVSLSAPVASPVSVQYRTQDGTATAGQDYVAASGTIVLAAGQTAATVPVSVVGDAEIEGDETFFFVLENPQGASLAFGTGLQTIVDDDPYKTFLTFDSQPGDWIGGGQEFTLTLVDGSITANRSANVVTVSFDGSTWWDLRFAAPEGATIVPGIYESATRWPFQSPTGPGLDVSGDGRGCNTLTGRFVVLEAVYDAFGGLERFAADYEQHCEGGVPALYGSARYRSAVPTGPRLSVAGATAYEGDFGTSALPVVVSLSSPAAAPVAVQYRTVDETATEGVDYVGASGTIVLSPGQSTATIPLAVVGDATIEPDETFAVVLENPVGATLAFGSAVATIVNDDPDKTILIFASQPGDYIGGGATFTLTPVDGSITAARESDNAVHVHFDGSTWWDLYFVAPDNGVLVPGVYENAMRWPFQDAGRPGLSVSGDGRGCNMLTGRFVVHEAVYDSGALTRLAVDYEQHCEGGTPALFGWVRFHSSVALPVRVFAEGGSATEGPGAEIVFKVKLSGPSGSPVTVGYATVDGTATGDVDYVRAFGTLLIPAGGLEAAVTVPVVDDTVFEGNETFGLEITGASGALIAGTSAVGTIVDDEEAPVVSVGDVTAREGDPGRPGIARVPVTLNSPPGQAVTLTYAATSGTALAGQDFVTPPGSTVIAPGQTSATIDVKLLADLEPEGDETFTVTLVSVQGANVGVSLATVTVEDDDGPTDYYTVAPCRLLDSRHTAPPLRPNGSLSFRAGGICGVPVTAKAVVLNVTAVAPSGTGHFRIGSTGTPRPPTSVLNFVAGSTRGVGPVVSMLGLNDAITLYAVMSGGSTHAVVDVFGYFE